MLARVLLYSSVVENYELLKKPTSSWLGLNSVRHIVSLSNGLLSSAPDDRFLRN
ncbi:hypothetical protein DPMN_075766 [Dreissena polymorpha]|uniref:Uncharacterized protein n=1 Tax=Dreissena polymorpha TaxID=45954 RepID=A0A9D4BPS0_DREPO|nr:hypothetical protein DPMN_075766 [Dreissena polymorpha]